MIARLGSQMNWEELTPSDRLVAEQAVMNLRELNHGVLDIYHALQHVSDLGKTLCADPESLQRWTDQMRKKLLREGWEGIVCALESSGEERSEAAETAIEGLLNYLAPHQQHLHCSQRLALGQSIGSGQIEGACKNLIGQRLKTNAARWRLRRVNRMAGLCSLLYSEQWQTYWETL